MRINDFKDNRTRETLDFRTKAHRRWKEDQWEHWLINRLREAGWRFRSSLKDEDQDTTSEEKLESSLLEEFQRFYKRINNLSSFRFTREEKRQLLQQLISFEVKDLTKPIVLYDSKERGHKIEIPWVDRINIQNNSFWVVQQVRDRKNKKYHIYDLVLLINGIPLICIELKKATISNKEAFNQLTERYEADRYQSKSLSIFNCFQIFIALNFQRIDYFWKKDLYKWYEDNNLQEWQMKFCDSQYLPLLSQITEFFNPSRIITQLFRTDTHYNWIKQRQRVYKARPENIETENIYYETRTTRIPSPRYSRMPHVNYYYPKPKVINTYDWTPVYCGIFSIGFFLLVSCLSGWAWWAVLIGLSIPSFVFLGLKNRINWMRRMKQHLSF